MVAVVLATGRTVYQYQHILSTATIPNKLVGLEENYKVFFPRKTDRDHLLNWSLESYWINFWDFIKNEHRTAPSAVNGWFRCL